MNRFKELREKSGFSVTEMADKLGYSERTVYRWEDDEDTQSPKKAIMDVLESYVTDFMNTNQSGDKIFNFIDLFAGIGGMRKGFESIGGNCVFTSEWDKYCRMTYTQNFQLDHDIAGDIREVDENDIPEHDVLLAGFPCQPFSIAGVSKKNSLGNPHGFLCQTQGTLFFDVARIIKSHRPSAFLLENVKNLVNHDKGKTFKVVKESLVELGYNIGWRVIDAKSFLPQHRERIFIVGFKNDNGAEFSDLELPATSAGPRLKSILHPEDGSEQPEPPFTSGDMAAVSDKYTLSEHLWQYLQNYAKKHKEMGNGFGFGLVGPEDVSRTLSARYYKDGSEILIRQDGKRPRRLTPRECSRLMGFDQSGESSFQIPVSDTQAYKQFGNAVAVPVVKAVAEFMKPYILGDKKRNGQLQLFSSLREPVHAYNE